MTIINEKAYKILENSIVKNAVSHFYIFHGPKNVGKKKLAYIFSRLLLCDDESNPNTSCDSCPSCKKIDEQKHFDILHVDSKLVVEGLDENKSDQIRLPHVEEISRQANLGPFMSKYKIFIVDEAEKLNNEASNAFLKLLEEPPSSTIFLFLVNDLTSVYPTIISRAQKINVLEIGKEDMKNYILENYDLDDLKIDQIINFSLGKIEVAETLSSDPSLLDNYFESYERFFEFCKSNISTRMELSQKFSTRFRTDRNAIYQELNLWIDFCNILINNSYQNDQNSLFSNNLLDLFEVKQINLFILEIIRSISNLRSNANSRLVFDVLSLNLPFTKEESTI